MMMAAGIVAAAVLVAGNAGESVKGAVEDVTTTARIETMFLFNDHLSPFKINTTTKGGVVTLTGGVETEEQKALAEDLARSLERVQNVVNRVTVLSDEAPPRRPKRGWRQRVEDRTTTASVRARLVYHKEFKGLRIGVRTENGVVRLSGVVSTDVQKHKIGQVAHDTRGVVRIINNLTVEPKESVDAAKDIGRHMADEWVEKRVETSIVFHRHINIRAVDVEVNGGVCILTGTVDTPSEKALAGSIAGGIQGVREVRNELRVREPEAAPASKASESSSTDEEYVPLP